MKLITSSSPHIRSGETTRRLMGTVLLALLPTLAAGVWFFGLRALLLTLVSVASCVASEWAFRAVTKSPGSIADGSAAVTGLLLALTLPATAPYWLAAVGGVFAIVVVKGLSGGLGQNIFNPALAARAFLMLLWPAWLVRYAPAGAELSPMLKKARIHDLGCFSLSCRFISFSKLPQTSSLLVITLSSL